MLRVLLVVTLACVASTQARAMHFSENPGVICGSEKLIRQHSYERENGRPYTVFKSSPGYKGGPSCQPAVVAVLKPRLLLVQRKDAFCAIRVMIAEDGVDQHTFWVHCLSVVDD